jgi:hypothetical protein
MVDVIQVPTAPVVPELYLLIGFSLVLNTALSMLTVWLTKRQQPVRYQTEEKKDSESRTKDILMLMALTSGRYDMLKRLLAYEVVADKGKIPENIAQLVGEMQEDSAHGQNTTHRHEKIPDLESIRNEFPSSMPENFVEASTEKIKNDVVEDVTKDLKKQLRQKLELEIKKNLYKKYGVMI